MADDSRDMTIARDFLSELEREDHPSFFSLNEIRADSIGIDGDTPLHVAVLRDNVDAARALILTGANVNAKGDLGKQPLHVAISFASLAMCELLVELGADLCVKDELGYVPATLALLRPTRDVAEYLDAIAARRRRGS